MAMPRWAALARFTWVVYAAAFALGGYLANGLAWFHWAYGELARALASESFRAVVGSWPLGLVLIVLVFREPFARRIGDLIELAVGGAKARFQPPPQQQPPLPPDLLDLLAPPNAPPAPAANALAPARPDERAHNVELFVTGILARVDDPWVLDHERAHRESLAPSGVLDVPDQAVRLLLRRNALWAAVAQFEYTYGIIWGGQVALMRDMQEMPVPMAQAAAFFEEWSKRYPDKPDTLDRWIRFLTSFGLIERTVDELLALTPKGRSFMRFLWEFNRGDPAAFR